MEELEAIDWYRQRADDCEDDELRAVLIHNMRDEMEHAAVLIEGIRRSDEHFSSQLDKFLHLDGPIAATGD